MGVVDLSDEETVIVLAATFTDSLAALSDKTRKLAVLKRIQKLLDSHAPRRYIYETVSGTDGLQIVRVGGDIRIYRRLVMGVPSGNERYNVLFVFYVDPHEYRRETLSRCDRAAQQRLTRSGHSSIYRTSKRTSTKRTHSPRPTFKNASSG